MQDDPLQTPLPPPIPHYDAPPPLAPATVGQWIAWTVVLLIAVGLFSLPYLAPKPLPSTIVNPAASSSFQLKLAARYAVGIKAYFGEQGGMLSGAIDQLS